MIQGRMGRNNRLALFIFVMAWLQLLAIHAQPIPDKAYSYICLKAQQKLCLGISTDTEPSYNPDSLLRLQVKRRENNEARGLDWMKTRWSVAERIGRIQLANFTTLCVSKETGSNNLPVAAVLRPCQTTGDLEQWNMAGFFDNLAEDGTVRLQGTQQCLTVMKCDRGTTPNTDYCNADVTKQYGGTTYDPEQLRGAHVKLMPCKANNKNQIWKQTIDCAPGCSPYMMRGANNECDLECANDECKWDNGACATPQPTPPTPKPSWSPTQSPTTSVPTKSPTKSPTATPTRQPTSSPTTSKPTASPTQTPSHVPTKSPSPSPSASPTAKPSASPTRSPSANPTQLPSANPTRSPSRAPTFAPTNATSIKSRDSDDPLLWLWILLGVLLGLLLLCCIFIVFGWRRRKQRKDTDKDGKYPDKSKDSESDVESPVRKPMQQNPDSEGGENVIFLSTESLPRKPPTTPVPPEGDKVQIPLVLPLRTPDAENPEDVDNTDLQEFAIKDSLNSISLTFSDANLTPRSAAAQASLFPDPAKRPKGGAPGMAWGGSHAQDLSESEKQDRAVVRQHSEAVQASDLPRAMNERSFKMPKEKITEGVAEVDAADVEKGFTVINE